MGHSGSHDRPELVCCGQGNGAIRGSVGSGREKRVDDPSARSYTFGVESGFA